MELLGFYVLAQEIETGPTQYLAGTAEKIQVFWQTLEEAVEAGLSRLAEKA